MFGTLNKTQKERLKLQRKEMRQKISLRIEAEALTRVFSFVAGVDGAISPLETKQYASFLDEWREEGASLRSELEPLAQVVSVQDVRVSLRTYLTGCRPTVAVRRRLLRGLCELAGSDGPINADEQRALDLVEELLQVRRANTAASRMSPKKEHSSPWYYQVLGCEEHDSDDVVKRAYRRLASILHPDKHAAQSSSPDHLRKHQEDFQKLQDAYEEIKKRRAALRAVQA
jgi:DnaJ-domain-containing protein 1